MLKKLLKYDLKDNFKFLIIFYILVIIIANLTRLFFALEQTTIIHIISQFFLGCFFAMIANTLINTLMRNWVRFKLTLFGDESYLTHTLPVTKSDLYQSKFYLSIITLLSSFTISLIGIFIVYYTPDRLSLLKNYMVGYFGSNNVTLLAIGFLVLFFLELLNTIFSGYTGILLGHKKNNNKILKSVIYGIIIYIISQIVLLLVVAIIGLFNKDILSIFISAAINYKLLKSLLIISLISYSVIAILQYFIGVKLLDKGVNVE